MGRILFGKPICALFIWAPIIFALGLGDLLYSFANEAPAWLVFQGRILKPDSNPLEAASVLYNIEVYSADGSCLLYEETHVVNMTGSGGTFALTLGTGIPIGPPYSMKEVFSNSGVFTGGGSCSYTPLTGDSRRIKVTFDDGGGPVALQEQLIQSVPYALYASKLEGKGKSDFLQINTTSSALSQANANSLFQNTTYSELMALAAGTSTVFAKATDLPVSSGVLNLSGAGQGVRVLDIPAGGDYAVNKNYSDGKIGGKAIDATNFAGLANGESVKWDTSANGSLGGWVRYTPASTGGLVVNGGQAGPVSLGPSNANSLTLLTNATARVTVDSSGNVGIGTSSPGKKLRVYDLNTSTSSKTGVQIDFDTEPTANQAPTIENIGLYVLHSGGTANALGDIVGIESYTNQSWGNSSVNQVIGGKYTADKNTGGAANYLYGLYSTANTWSGGTAGAVAGLVAGSEVGSGTVTDQFGVKINDVAQTGGSVVNRYGLYIGSFTGTATTNDFGIFQAGPIQKNYFSGNVGIGTAVPTAVLQLKAGTAASNTAPLKFTSGTLLTTPENGTLEYDGTSFYYTTGGSRTTFGSGGGPTLSGITSISNAGGDITLAPMTSTGTVLVNSGTASVGVNSGAIVVTGGVGVSGSLNVGGSYAMSGSGTFNTGTGAVSLNGATTVAANQNLSMASGTGTFTQTYTGTGTAATITANSLTSGNILSLTSNSTSAAAGNMGLNIGISGANGSSSITRYGLQSSVTSTGTSSTNVGASFSASGATNNYGLLVPNGQVGIGTTNPSASLAVSRSTGGSIAEFSTGSALTASQSSFNISDTSTTATPAIDKSALKIVSTGSWSNWAGRNRAIEISVGGAAGGINDWNNIGVDVTNQSQNDFVGHKNTSVFTGSGSHDSVGVQNEFTAPSGSFNTFNLYGVYNDFKLSNTVGGSASGYGVMNIATVGSGNEYTGTSTTITGDNSATGLVYVSDSTIVYPGDSSAYGHSVTISSSNPSGYAVAFDGTLNPTGSSTSADGMDLYMNGANDGLAQFMTGIETMGKTYANDIFYGARILSSASSAGGSQYGVYVDLSSGSATTKYSGIFMGGNVGIGTTSPGKKLSVTTASATDGLRIINSVASWGQADITPNQISLWPDSPGTNRLDIRNSVNDGVHAFSVDTVAGSLANAIVTVWGNHIIQPNTDTTGAFQIKNAMGTSTLMNVDTTTGNVGIGATSPSARLDVTDTGTTTSAIIVPRAGNFTGTSLNGMIRYNTTSTLFEFHQNGTWVNYTTVSDGRLKTNVEPVVNGLDIVNQLKPVFFDWDRSNPKASSFDDNHQVGFIAQEVEKVLPEVVNKGEDNYRSLEYGKIVSVVVAAVKELYSKVLGIESDVDILKARDAVNDHEIASVKAENAKLKAEVGKQKQEISAIRAYLCAKDREAAICK